MTELNFGGVSERVLTRDEVRMHNSASSCWIIVDDIVYDITKFTSQHPGRAVSVKGYRDRSNLIECVRLQAPLLRMAGKDATPAGRR